MITNKPEKSKVSRISKYKRDLKYYVDELRTELEWLTQTKMPAGLILNKHDYANHLRTILNDVITALKNIEIIENEDNHINE